MQKRAIETRQKIINAALEMYATKGYHSTTVDEIAAKAEVSTGIAYRYFKNKKDLLLGTLQSAFENIQTFTQTSQTDFSRFKSFDQMINYALIQFEDLHKKYFSIHEELESLRHTDDDVKKFYDEVEKSAISALIPKIKEMLPNVTNLNEKIMISINLMENYCHMSCDPKYKDLDYDIMKNITIKQICNIFC